LKVIRSLALLACSAPLFGQAPDAPDAQPIRVDVDVVNVLCTVSDKHGALITNLGKDDFEVRENGRKQQIRYFARDTDLPLTVAMLMDVSGSVREAIGAEREAAGRISPPPPRNCAVLSPPCTRFRSAAFRRSDSPCPAPCSMTPCIRRPC